MQNRSILRCQTFGPYCILIQREIVIEWASDSCYLFWILLVKSAGSGCQYSESKEGNKASEDTSSTPEQFIPLKKERKAHARRRTEGRRRVEIQVPSSKKKCVNGFIMFCRMNRKVYLRCAFDLIYCNNTGTIRPFYIYSMLNAKCHFNPK